MKIMNVKGTVDSLPSKEIIRRKVVSTLTDTFEKYGIKDVEVIQIAVSKLNSKNSFEQQPAPWLISGSAVQK